MQQVGSPSSGEAFVACSFLLSDSRASFGLKYASFFAWGEALRRNHDELRYWEQPCDAAFKNADFLIESLAEKKKRCNLSYKEKRVQAIVPKRL